jgi:GntR family transcriptional regulator/MocR family aminotransferase
VAKKHDALILEDDYDSEFATPPSARFAPGLDRDGRVIYLGTFSKTVFPVDPPRMRGCAA